MKIMVSERILQLLAKQMGHAASDKEIAELMELLSQHPEYHYYREILQSIEGEKQHYEPATEEEDLVQESWSMLERVLPFGYAGEAANSNDEDLAVRKRVNIRTWIYRAAIWVGVIILAGGSFYMWKSFQTKQAQPVALEIKQVAVPFGAPEKKMLPDSSIVWLNAGSHIRYAGNFIQKKREVYLDGEAYFDVKHDAGRPFIVHAGNIMIKVLGTEFNIKAYDDENHIETTLISGKVQVEIAGKPDKKIVLTPHEKLTVVNEKFNIHEKGVGKLKELSFQVKEVGTLKAATSIPEVAWLQDKLAFQNESFDELARKLERRYDVHIVFRDTLLEKEKLSGVFENENIQKALKILQMTTPFVYEIQGDTVFLKH
jgi:ferric-dicitrate binding protein FerR (iron transport regulator)